MNSYDPLKIEIDLNVLNHLGIGLYSNTPAVLTEIVANAWDADAHEVVINLSNEAITIKDNGHGMDYAALQSKFLTVGYARRLHGEETSPDGRQCMGRKGIGKLAMFSLANEIHLVSKKVGGSPHGFIVIVKELKEKIEAHQVYFPTLITEFSEYPIVSSGTIIVLKQLDKNINKTEKYLRRRIARRFSVIGEKHNFKINLQNSPIKITDRGFYEDIQFLWSFGDAEKEISALCVNKKKHRHFDGVTVSGHVINGFIASVVKPEQLKKQDDNNNTITLLANGRIFEEDIQKRIDDSRIFNSYLVGELQYDWLDANAEVDIAVSSRQGVQENDIRFQEFIGFIKSRLSDIAKDWDDWRRELGSDQIVNDFPKIGEWLETLKPNHRIKAKQLITKINTMRFTGSDEEQKSQRREILKSQVLAFEKLKIQDNLESIELIDVEKNINQFREVMITVEDLEASLHYDIISQRLAVIKKLDNDQQNKVKEVIVQEHIYNHLWLIDSKWEYKEFPTEWELRLTDHLKMACPDTTEGARLDIGYRTTSGRFVVIELKRPGLPVKAKDLLDQGEKYVMALTEYFSKHPDSAPIRNNSPRIDVIFVVDTCPDLHPIYESRLDNINGRITTYRDLVTQATNTYEDYIQASKKVGRIKEIFTEL